MTKDTSNITYHTEKTIYELNTRGRDKKTFEVIRVYANYNGMSHLIGDIGSYYINGTLITGSYPSSSDTWHSYRWEAKTPNNTVVYGYSNNTLDCIKLILAHFQNRLLKENKKQVNSKPIKFSITTEFGAENRLGKSAEVTKVWADYPSTSIHIGSIYASYVNGTLELHSFNEDKTYYWLMGKFVDTHFTEGFSNSKIECIKEIIKNYRAIKNLVIENSNNHKTSINYTTKITRKESSTHSDYGERIIDVYANNELIGTMSNYTYRGLDKNEFFVRTQFKGSPGKSEHVFTMTHGIQFIIRVYKSKLELFELLRQQIRSGNKVPK